MANKHTNAIVVGAGAGGGIVAKELATAGISVVLFERGEWPNYDEHPNDELISQRSEVLGSPFGPDHLKNPRVLVRKDGSRQVVTPIRGGYGNNAACVGSGTVSYGAMAWRFMEEDFKLKTFNGRAGCIRNRTCCGFACPVDAKNGTPTPVSPVAMATGNCEARTGCMVVEILVDDHGRATGVKYFDRNNQPQVQTADVVVVSGAAVETARLLLNSQSKLFPYGAGNNYDWVGRNLMGHAYTGAYGLFDYDLLDFAGPGATVAWCDFNHHNPGIIGGGLLANEFNRLPYLYCGVRPPGATRWGKEHKEFQRNQYHRTAQVVGPIQEMPMFESRVTIEPRIKDFWGTPVAAMSGERHPLDHEHCKFLSAKAEALLREAGAYQTWQSVGGQGGPSGGQHQNGTARMGNDKRTSVVNQFGQIHEIDNLFVADGSVLPNGGGFNPALTIMAIGFWVGGHLAKNFAGTKFK